MNILAALADPRILEFVGDQRLRELVTKQEFRVTEEYLETQFVSKAGGGEVEDLSLRFHDGHAVISGKVTKKVVVPLTIPFSLRFSVGAITFTKEGKKISLKIEEVKPVDLDWVTKKIVEKLPFLSFEERLVTCDLTKIPQLDHIFGYSVKGIRVADFVTLRDLEIRKGEVIGRIGLAL